MAEIIIAEIEVSGSGSPPEEIVRVGTGAYIHPSAPGPYLDAIRPLETLYRREIFRDGAAYGVSSPDYGVIALANADGQFDWLADVAADGRPISLLIGDDQAAYSTFAPLLVGVVSSIEVGLSEVTIRLQDTAAAVLDRPIGLTQLGGANSPPSGVDGSAEQAGQWLPVIYGSVYNVSPVLVNSAKLIYAVCDRAVEAVTISAVRDLGAAITAGSARASIALLESTAPTAGTYDWFAGSPTEAVYIRLGSTPAGDITCDVSAGTAPTVAQICERIITERAGQTGFIAGDLTALDALDNSAVGGWFTGAETRREALDWFAASVGAGIWQDATGAWRIRQITAPATPVAAFASGTLSRPLAVGEGDIITIEPLFTSRAETGVPTYKVSLRCARNYTVQSKDSLAGIAVAIADRLSREYLEHEAVEDGAVLALHPLSVPMEAVTAFASQADALAEAQRRLDLFGVPRRRYTLAVTMTSAVAAAIDLGVTVTVEFPRFGLSSGRDFVVTGITTEARDLVATLTIWG